jgi:hypothetical protein
MTAKKIESCRVSGDTNLIPVVNLGNQCLTGVFPRSIDDHITSGPLELVWSPESQLLQLAHSYDLGEMYGDNYGYRSGLNSSMVNHLNQKVEYLTNVVHLNSGDFVLDIGSNDGTTLNAYSNEDITRVGIDPTLLKWKEYYQPGVLAVNDFFGSSAYFSVARKPAKIVTSIAMFYDLESPVDFCKNIKSVLDRDGIWHFEQSYMPSMLRTNAYDTICHEHLEFYSLGNICRILDKADLKVLDVSFNSVNGGSFAVTAAHKDSRLRSNSQIIGWYLKQEANMKLDSPAPYRLFEERIYHHRKELMALISLLKGQGSTIAGYGASTKGNVLLQFSGLDTSAIDYIVDVNPLKWGSFTPGTNIPIVSETYFRDNLPDYCLVLPWHFRPGILEREKDLLQQGVKFIFPLPEIEIV